MFAHKNSHGINKKHWSMKKDSSTFWPLYLRWEWAISLSTTICIFFRFLGQKSSRLALFCRNTGWRRNGHFNFDIIKPGWRECVFLYWTVTYMGIVLRSIIIAWRTSAVMASRRSGRFQHLSSLKKPIQKQKKVWETRCVTSIAHKIILWSRPCFLKTFLYFPTKNS